MPRLLLDHPWPIEETLEPASDAHGVLLQFVDLIRESRLAPVPFISSEDWGVAIPKLRPHHSAKAAIFRIVNQHLLRPNADGPLATPLTAAGAPVPDLNERWRASLREHLDDDADWMHPQIVVTAKRSGAWPLEEVLIRREDVPQSAPVSRLVVPLPVASYLSQKYAVTDVDPWRSLQFILPAGKSGGATYPAILPRPPGLSGVPIEDLPGHLAAAIDATWNVQGQYYFIPEANWTRFTVSKPDWRKSGGFPIGTVTTKKGLKRGPRDYAGRIWSWDQAHGGHWDVQLPGGEYVRISNRGVMF